MTYKVKYWTTTADIHLVAEGYDSEHFAPGYQGPLLSGYSDHQVVHHCITTHAMVYKLYNEEFKENQQGKRCDILIYNIYIHNQFS